MPLPVAGLVSIPQLILCECELVDLIIDVSHARSCSARTYPSDVPPSMRHRVAEESCSIPMEL